MPAINLSYPLQQTAADRVAVAAVGHRHDIRPAARMATYKARFDHMSENPSPFAEGCCVSSAALAARAIAGALGRSHTDRRPGCDQALEELHQVCWY